MECNNRLPNYTRNSCNNNRNINRTNRKNRWNRNRKKNKKRKRKIDRENIKMKRESSSLSIRWSNNIGI